MALTPIPNVACGIGTSAVIVRAYKVLVSPSGVESPPVPISSASVKYNVGAFFLAEEYYETTDSLGIASHCFTHLRQVAVKIKKDGEDFGSGLGQWKSLSVPTRGRSNISIDAKAVHHEAPPPVISPPPITPPPTPPSPLCPQLVTTVDSINHPAEITDFNATFYVYLRGVREICKTDPTNPAFIKRVQKGTMGTITLGSLSSIFYLTDDGIVDIDLSKLISLPSLAGAVGGITPPVAVQPPLPSERIGSYCTLKPFIMSGQTFYDVIHDTAGKIYSGNTYEQAKYKAQQDTRCFPKAALPCVKISIYHTGSGSNAIIGFKSSIRNKKYAEGNQAWGWAGYPKLSDAEYMRTVAIPQTMSYLGITKEEICP